MKASLFNLGFLTFIFVNICACNKSDKFYQKDSLSSSSNVLVTDGSNTSGGSDGGASGSNSGSSSGSSSGGTSGGASGSSSGGYKPQQVSETFNQDANSNKKLDIIWVVDDSGSMKNKQVALGTNFSSFINDFIKKDFDFKMAITTTDCSSSAKCGKTVQGSDVVLNSLNAKADPVKFKADFNTLVKVGVAGSGYEMGLKAVDEFILKDQNPNKALKFLREDSHLAIVIISDEDDGSVATVGTMPFDAVEKYTNAFKTLKSKGDLIKTYFVVDQFDRTVYQPGKQPANLPGSSRYKSAAVNTSGMVMDVYADFAPSLAKMSADIIQLLDSFVLSNRPIAGSLKVYVNNIESTDYTYNDTTISIKFNQNALPPVGAVIKVNYLK